MFHAAREKLFHFTTPFYVVNHAVYAPESHPQVNGSYNFSGQRVAVEERSVAHEKLVAENFEVDIVLTPSTQAALEAVLSGHADSVVTTEPTAEYLINNLDLPLNRVSPPFWPSSYAFAVKHGRDDLHLWLQNALNAAIASNGYQDIYENWKSEIRPDGNSLIHIPFYVGYTAITAILLMVTFFSGPGHCAAKSLTRRQISKLPWCAQVNQKAMRAIWLIMKLKLVWRGLTFYSVSK